ncbi:MAG: fumarylacetoacetate hydrolase family protein [Proteobacteria bacterium]|nr:fumarylacetoacetate hydrolase family protein [Pseudomonadota bacterium]
MKLISFGPAGQERPGVLLDDNTILDIICASSGEIQTIRALLEQGEAGLAKVAGWIDSGPQDNWLTPSKGQRLGPPLTNPSKIVCVGLNYHSHTGEQSVRLPKRPLLFSKSVTSLGGQNDPIWYPADEENVDYEAELAFVIGKPAFRVNPDDWESYIAGYTIVNDVSGRDAQFGDRKWFRGKSFDSFCPMGPYLVTRDEIPDPESLRLTAHLNGEKRQDANTKDLIFGLAKLLAFTSLNITLQPGDVLATGTPGGVGIFCDPPACMSVGDKIEVYVEKIGTLTNHVRERETELPSVYPYPKI